MMNKIFVRITVFLLASALISVCACTGIDNNEHESQRTPLIASYRDIPELTEQELNAIDALREEVLSRGRPLIVGNPLNTESFVATDGTIGGFIPLLCEWLTDFFEIPFEAEIYNLNYMLEGLLTGEIDIGTNTPTPERLESYYMTEPIYYRSLRIMRIYGSLSPYDIMNMRPVRYVFMREATQFGIAQELLAPDTYESLFADTFDDMYHMLKNGEADAMLLYNSAEAAFDQYGDVIVEEFLPLSVNPATLSTGTRELEPIISAITKSLNYGVYDHLSVLYKQGYHNYLENKFNMRLTDEEKAYILENPVIPFAAQYMSYPISFYNSDSKQWEGIIFDILPEIEAITGLTFELVNDTATELADLMDMLESGRAYMMPNLIYSYERAQRFIWTESAYMSDNYALLSKQSYPNVDPNDVPFERVGMAVNSAYAEVFNLWFPNAIRAVIYPTTDAMYDALERGEINLAMSSRSRLLSLANYYEYSDYKANYIFSDSYTSSFGLNKDQTTLRSILDKALPLINTDRIVNQWMSTTYNFEAMRMQQQRPWFIGAIVFVTVMLTIVSIILINNNNKRKIITVQNKLLEAVSQAAAFLLNTEPDSFEEILYHSMKVLAEATDADRMHIWKNHTVDGELYCTQIYEWSEKAEPQQNGLYTTEISYKESAPGWEEELSQGNCINAIVKDMSPVVQAQLAPQAILSILVVPVFLENKLWGFMGFDDCHKERIFTEQEETILRSSSLLFALAYQRNDMLQVLNATSEELKKALNEANNANRAKNDFLAKISHEIRTPMNAIIGMTELALRNKDIDIVYEHLHTVKKASTVLLALINDVLDFSKIEAGKMEIIQRDYSIASLIDDVISIIRMRVVDSQIYLVAKIDSNVPATLYGDDIKIRQILLNILGNAAKYTEKGYISLGVTCKFTGSNTLMLKFEVKDTGIGIKSEDIDKLFTDFTQIDVEKNVAVEGVGLGLSITRNIVSNMGGDITVESQYGVGSLFTVIIPQLYHSRDILANVTEPEEKQSIVYEDNDIYAEAINYTLENLGIKYTAVTDNQNLYRELNSHIYKYLFIAHNLYLNNKDALEEYINDVSIVVLTEFGETKSDKKLKSLTMPVLCTHISEVLNGAGNKKIKDTDTEPIADTTATEARILIVDDIKTNLKVAEGLLKPYKVKIDLCTGGEAAVRAVQSTRYDMIFMDHKMPGVDGVQATVIIRAMGKSDSYYRDVPIIALTANAVAGAREMYLKNGFNDFLPKPIDITELDALLKKWIPNEKWI